MSDALSPASELNSHSDDVSPSRVGCIPDMSDGVCEGALVPRSLPAGTSLAPPPSPPGGLPAPVRALPHDSEVCHGSRAVVLRSSSDGHGVIMATVVSQRVGSQPRAAVTVPTIMPSPRLGGDKVGAMSDAAATRAVRRAGSSDTCAADCAAAVMMEVRERGSITDRVETV